LGPGGFRVSFLAFGFVWCGGVESVFGKIPDRIIGLMRLREAVLLLSGELRGGLWYSTFTPVNNNELVGFFSSLWSMRNL